MWFPLSADFVEPARRRPAYLNFMVIGAMHGSIQWLPYLAHVGWLKVSFLGYAARYPTSLYFGRLLTFAVHSGLAMVPRMHS